MSTPPRRTLPWQQRRPNSGSLRKPSNNNTNTPPSPPLQPTIPTASSSSSPSSHRLSVSSLSQNFSSPPPLQQQQQRHVRTSSGVKGTFAPQFIKDKDVASSRRDVGATSGGVGGGAAGGEGIAGENSDFSGRRWVWVKDPEKAFVKGEVLDDQDGMLTVRCENGSVRIPRSHGRSRRGEMLTCLGTHTPSRQRGQSQSGEIRQGG